MTPADPGAFTDAALANVPADPADATDEHLEVLAAITEGLDAQSLVLADEYRALMDATERPGYDLTAASTASESLRRRATETRAAHERLGDYIERTGRATGHNFDRPAGPTNPSGETGTTHQPEEGTP